MNTDNPALHDTYYVVAHAHWMLGPAIFFGLVWAMWHFTVRFRGDAARPARRRALLLAAIAALLLILPVLLLTTVPSTLSAGSAAYIIAAQAASVIGMILALILFLWSLFSLVRAVLKRRG